MIKFKEGTTYFMRSACDHECIWKYWVARRTAKTVWLMNTQTKTTTSHRINQWEGVEQCSPLGKYSMSPILGADKAV